MPRLSARNNKELRALAKGLGVPMSKLEPGPLPILLAGSLCADLPACNRRQVLDDWNTIGAGCQSPIERMLLWALLGEHVFSDVIAPAYAITNANSGDILCVQQAVCGFTADFVINAKPRATRPGRLIVIECDGHEWHSDRKRMARDRKRDRDIQKAGHVILRFTGSQIVNDPKACAQEVLQFIKG